MVKQKTTQRETYDKLKEEHVMRHWLIHKLNYGLYTNNLISM